MTIVWSCLYFFKKTPKNYKKSKISFEKPPIKLHPKWKLHKRKLENKQLKLTFELSKNLEAYIIISYMGCSLGDLDGRACCLSTGAGIETVTSWWIFSKLLSNHTNTDTSTNTISTNYVSHFNVVLPLKIETSLLKYGSTDNGVVLGNIYQQIYPLSKKLSYFKFTTFKLLSRKYERTYKPIIYCWQFILWYTHSLKLEWKSDP